MVVDEYGNQRFFGIYRGVVRDNRDPLGKGRVKLQIPQILFDAITDWAWAKDSHGVHVDPPVVGQGVWVQFEGGDPSFPVWVGTFGDNPVEIDVPVGSLAFDDLTDVTITSPTNRQVPVYNSTTGVWENSSVAIPAGGDAGEVLAKVSDDSYSVAWVTGTQVPTSTVKHIVRNDSGVTLPKGTVVYTSGANGNHILVQPAIATADQYSSQVVGFLEVSLAPNADGYAISEGLLGDLNTSAAGDEGDPMWLSYTVAGGVTYGFANEPYAPTHTVYLGVVTRKNPVNGEIFIRISNGWELDELHNVNINHANARADKDILQYDSGTSLWKNTSLGSNSLYVGTTQIALNRASASQALTGVTSIDGSAATLTTSRTLWGQSFNGSANVTGSLTSVGDITGSGAVTITAGGTNTNIVLAPNGTGTVDFSSKNITSVGTITATTFSGSLSGNATSATSATTFTVTSDATTASAVYPVWVTANSGNVAGTVTSTKLTFVPSTGTLSTTTFSGALSGTATRATNIVGGSNTTLLGAIPYQSNTDTTTLLSPNTTSTKKFLRQTGTGTNGAAPAWDTVDGADITSGQVPAAYGGVPTGAIFQWVTASAPSGYLLCDGSSVSTTGTYANLFGVIGYTYGGSGASFALPNFQARVPIGAQAPASLGTATITIAAPGVVTRASHGLATGNIVYFTTTGALPTGITATTGRYWAIVLSSSTFQLASSLANALAGTAITTSGTQSGTHTVWSSDFELGRSNGENDHTLTSNEMPSHTHVQDSHNHTQNSHNHTQNAHTHTSNAGEGSGSGAVRDAPAGGTDGYKATYYTPSLVINSTTATNIATTATNIATTATNQNTGGGLPFNTLPQYLVTYYIIKT